MKGKNLKGVVQDINKFTGTPDTRMSYSQFSQDFPVYEKPAAVQNVELKKKPAGTKTTTGSSKPKKDWNNCFETYEEAELACLNKLIEIVKL